MKSKTYNGEVRSGEKDFETLQLGAFASPGLLLAQGADCGIRVHRSTEWEKKTHYYKIRSCRRVGSATEDLLILAGLKSQAIATNRRMSEKTKERRSTSGIPTTRLRPAPGYLILAFCFVLILLCTSVGANILGFFDLASVLSRGSFATLYAGFALYATAVALSVMLAVLLDTGAARALAIVPRHGARILRVGVSFVHFAAFVLWFTVFLNAFGVKGTVTRALTSFATAPLNEGRVNFSLWDALPSVSSSL